VGVGQPAGERRRLVEALARAAAGEPAMRLIRHRVRVAFSLDAMLAILAAFVLHGTVAGVTALAAMLVFIFACIAALRQPNADLGGRTDRTGLVGWIGHWF
jgi:hypothetical protein